MPHIPPPSALSLSLSLSHLSLLPSPSFLRYLDRERTAAGESYLVRYSWGPRAQVELDKREVLAIVAEIYEGDLSQWERQFSDILDNSVG